MGNDVSSSIGDTDSPNIVSVSLKLLLGTRKRTIS